MIPAGTLVLLDTNILVHLIRQNPVGRRLEADHALAARPDRPLVSYVTIGELHALTLKLGWEVRKRSVLEELVHQVVVVHLHQADILDHYAKIDFYSEKTVKPARPIGQNDLWIAATASAFSAVLVTTDNDFDHLTPQFFNCVKVHPRTGASRWVGK